MTLSGGNQPGHCSSLNVPFHSVCSLSEVNPRILEFQEAGAQGEKTGQGSQMCGDQGGEGRSHAQYVRHMLGLPSAFYHFNKLCNLQNVYYRKKVHNLYRTLQL